MKILEVLLGKNTELNDELAEILEETDETLEEYKKDNKDLRIKLWKAIWQIREKEAKVNELELEIEEISDENEELNSKLIDKDWDFKVLKRNYEKEKKVSGTKESQKKKGYTCNSRMGIRNGYKFMYKKSTWGENARHKNVF